MKTPHNLQKHRQNGFSIVELMIAILIGIILLTGLIKVFDTSSQLNRTQNGLARIQENGRYAIESMKRNLENAGYSYCMGRSNSAITLTQMSPKYAWQIDATPFLAGFGTGTFDPAYLIHGHECSAGSCAPALNAAGTGADSGIPATGTAQGDRIDGTDVITIRYLRGPGKEVFSVNGATGSPANTIFFSQYDQTNPSATTMPASGQVLLVGCNDGTPPQLLSITGSGVSSLSVATPPSAGMGRDSLARVFNFQQDFVTVTYFVANNIVNGRSIPTLYSRVNGTNNEVVQGVDAFDVLYGVKLNDGAGSVQFMTADQVDAMSVNCSPTPIDASNGRSPILNPAPNCGWRSVVALDVHLLLNTIFNSTTNPNEQFNYSPYGTGYYTIGDLPNGINHYFMYRREFYTAVALKNLVD